MISFVHSLTKSDKLSYSYFTCYHRWKKNKKLEKLKLDHRYVFSHLPPGAPYRFKNKLFWSWFINVRHYDGLLFTVKEPKECVKFNTFTFSNKCLLNVTSSCNIIWCPVNTFRVKDVKLCFIFHPWTLYLMLFPSDSHSEKLLDGHMCHSLSVVSPPFCNGVTDTP